jgi:hypothetical protein
MQEALSIALTPEDALRRWCDATSVRAMSDLSYYAERAPITILGAPPTNDELMHEQYWRLRQPMEDHVLHNLRTGVWTATALESPITLRSERIRVPAHFWRFLKLDFKTASAKGKGLRLVEIEIEHSNDAQVPEPSPSPAAASRSQLQLTRPGAPLIQIHLSDDDAILTLLDEKLILRGSIQKSIVRQLVDGHAADRPLRTSQVLSKANSQADSIAKAFRGNPVWPALKQVLRQQRGFCWLDLRSPP